MLFSCPGVEEDSQLSHSITSTHCTLGMSAQQANFHVAMEEYARSVPQMRAQGMPVSLSLISCIY